MMNNENKSVNLYMNDLIMVAHAIIIIIFNIYKYQWRSQEFFEWGDNLNFSYKKSSLQSFEISSVNSNPRGGDLSPDHPTWLRH